MEKSAFWIFKGVKIINFNFSSQYIVSYNEKPEISVTSKVYNFQDTKKEIILIMKVSINLKDSYNFNTLVLGTFEIQSKTSKNELEHLINQKAPYIVFPYIKEFITNASHKIGIPIQVLDFSLLAPKVEIISNTSEFYSHFE